MKYDLRVRDSFGNNLEVLQELPDKGDKFPTVLVVPGFGADAHESGFFDDISDALVKNGFQTIRFSFEGTGKSEGSFLDMTLTKQIQQLKDILKYVKKDRFTNPRKLGLLAQSFGTATTVAALPFSGFKSFLFTSSVVYPYESLSKLFKRQRGFDPEGVSERQKADNTDTRIGPQFWKDLGRYNLPQQIKKLNNQILFIHGGNDRKVKVWEAEELYNAVNIRKKFQVIEKADHAFTREFRPKLLELIVVWFNETLS